MSEIQVFDSGALAVLRMRQRDERYRQTLEEVAWALENASKVDEDTLPRLIHDAQTLRDIMGYQAAKIRKLLKETSNG